MFKLHIIECFIVTFLNGSSEDFEVDFPEYIELLPSFRMAVRTTPQTPRDSRKKSKGACMVYPVGNEEITLRSHERHLELARQVHPDLDMQHDFYGVKPGVSFIIETLPHLDIINDVIIDYMHNCLLGTSENKPLFM